MSSISRISKMSKIGKMRKIVRLERIKKYNLLWMVPWGCSISCGKSKAPATTYQSCLTFQNKWDKWDEWEE